MTSMKIKIDAARTCHLRSEFIYRIMSMLFILLITHCLFSTGEDEVILGCNKSEYPKRHLKYMRNLQNKSCSTRNKGDVCQKTDKISKSCWGYEDGCDAEKYAFQYPKCQVDQEIKKIDINELFFKYWNQGGFAYLRKKMESIETYCASNKKGGSTLKCTKSEEFCEVDNLFIDLSKVEFSNNLKKSTEFLKGGNAFGGDCKMIKKFKTRPTTWGSLLSSWYSEMRYFKPLKRPETFDKCDEMINGTTFIMKLDMGFNLHHHMTNFLNLYLTQHMLRNFSTDVRVIVWNTARRNFVDFYSETWEAFSRNPKTLLHELDGKKLCFKHAVFPLLPRMPFGIFYNTPLEKYCQGGGVLQAFSDHVLHRLKIPPYHFDGDTIRITLISRMTQHRNILNEEELVAAMKMIPGVEIFVAKFKYKEFSFLEQLKVIQNTDIMMSIHGAGLTHMLFQPNWGAVFEIFNTEDVNCYKDLASLRDLSYFTWEKENLLQKENQVEGKNAKFADYRFDIEEFVRIVNRMVKLVKLKRPKNRK